MSSPNSYSLDAAGCLGLAMAVPDNAGLAYRMVVIH